MRVFHRLAVDKDRRTDFLRIGVDLLERKTDADSYYSFVVLRFEESDPRWVLIKEQCLNEGTLELIDTEFSAEELGAASNLCFRSNSFAGYPEPSGDGGYREITYDLSEYCAECGTGRRQKAPFRMKSEVKWGRRTTTQMHWVFDEIFVRPETWRDVFEPFGIPFWPVHSRKDVKLDSVVQLRIDALAELEVPAELPRKACRACGRVKYAHPERGYWPRPLTQPGPIFKSTQYFGDGHQAEREMFVSQELYQAMIKHKLNCRYWACASE